MVPLRFDPQVHTDEVSSWHVARGLLALQPGNLPPHGLIVPGVAAGFLYLTDAPVAFIENLIANPASSREERDAALDAIANGLCSIAEGKGCKGVLAFTRLPVVVERAKRHGFTDRGAHTIIVKDFLI